MATIAVREERAYGDRDPADTWAEVGDLARFGEWFPIRHATSMTGAVPQVGNIIFVAFGRSHDPERAIRLEVIEWEAGRRYVCEARQVPGIEDGRFVVAVDGTPSGGTTVMLSFVGDASGFSGRLMSYEIGGRMRGALDRFAS